LEFISINTFTFIYKKKLITICPPLFFEDNSNLSLVLDFGVVYWFLVIYSI